MYRAYLCTPRILLMRIIVVGRCIRVTTCIAHPKTPNVVYFFFSTNNLRPHSLSLFCQHKIMKTEEYNFCITKKQLNNRRYICHIKIQWNHLYNRVQVRVNYCVLLKKIIIIPTMNITISMFDEYFSFHYSHDIIKSWPRKGRYHLLCTTSSWYLFSWYCWSVSPAYSNHESVCICSNSYAFISSWLVWWCIYSSVFSSFLSAFSECKYESFEFVRWGLSFYINWMDSFRRRMVV